MTMPAEWIGPVGDAWADEWQRTDRSFADLAQHLNAAILDRATADVKTIVDIGCGAGATSLALAAARPDAQVIGIDISPGLVAVAKARGAGIANLRFAAGAVETLIEGLAPGDLPVDHPVDLPVDLYVSRHGVMFFSDPDAAFARLHDAAAPGAGLVFSCFRAPSLNLWASEIAAAIAGEAASPPTAQGYAPGPFAFADPDRVSAILTAAGWQSPECVAVDFRYRAGAGEDAGADALSFFQRIGPAASLFRAAGPDERAAMLARMAAVIDRYESSNSVDFPAAAWLWSARKSSNGKSA